MNEHNRAIRMAQKFIRAQANTFDGHEDGSRQWRESPKTLAFREAANRLEALIFDGEGES